MICSIVRSSSTDTINAETLSAGNYSAETQSDDDLSNSVSSRSLPLQLHKVACVDLYDIFYFDGSQLRLSIPNSVRRHIQPRRACMEHRYLLPVD
jgi:hypothetical protein